MNKNRSLNTWLAWIKALHVKEIDLSLERVAEVGARLNLLKPNCPVITVAGTNGKGSCAAALEAFYLAAGYKAGAFTTPYLFRYNEQVRIQGHSADDHLFCDAFDRITEACGQDISLTVFEYGTLAAFMIFKEANLDVWILEVGMGGRWDAVNVIDADVAIVASIGIDHVDWLGHTRELIAIEKAGIFRKGKPAVCGDFDPPKTLIHSPIFCQGKDFGFKKMDASWTWWCSDKQLTALPLPTLLLQNMSTALMTVELLQSRLPVCKEAIEKALLTVSLPGRIQVVPGDVLHIFDVSHNPAAVLLLAEYLKNNANEGKTYAIFSMLADKDIDSTLDGIKSHINQWHIAPVESERACSLEKLSESFEKADIREVAKFQSIKMAYEHLKSRVKTGDRVVVFGSFRTVAEVLEAK